MPVIKKWLDLKKRGNSINADFWLTFKVYSGVAKRLICLSRCKWKRTVLAQCAYTSWCHIFQYIVDFSVKQSKTGEVCQVMVTKSSNFMTCWWETTCVWREIHEFKTLILFLSVKFHGQHVKQAYWRPINFLDY